MKHVGLREEQWSKHAYGQTIATVGVRRRASGLFVWMAQCPAIISVPMPVTSKEISPLSPAWVWLGRAISAVVVLFLLFDGTIKLVRPAAVVDAFRALGYPLETASGIGLLGLGCAALYAFPRTAVFGAVLLTGLLGGAISSHVRVNDPLFSHTLFGLYLGVMAWGGLWMRDARVRAMLPLR